MNNLPLLTADLEKAVQQLAGALARESNEPLVQAGCIHYFEFCFELAWKTIKQAALDQGLPDCLSPRACLRQAFALGWIGHEECWLEMLSARNAMAHTYNTNEALVIYQKLPAFLVELKSLAENIKTVALP